MDECGERELSNCIENNVMWNTLISALKKEIQSKNSHLETILKMIETNLTYDDPGLFTLKNPDSEDERKRLEVYNTWLFNQLLFVLIDDKFSKSRVYNLRLQKEMLSASIIKQPWFFYRVIKKFIHMLNLLNKQKLPFDGATSLEINLFHSSDVNFTNLCEFLAIKINDEFHFKLLYDHCVEVLAHAIVLYTNQNNSLELESNQVMLKSFFRASLNSKILIINYFIILFKENLKMSSNKNSRHIELYSNELLKGICSSVERVFLINDQDQMRLYDKFYNITLTFVKNLLNLNLNIEFKIKHFIYVLDIIILLIKFNRTENILYENLINLLKINLTPCKKLFNSRSLHNKILDNLTPYIDEYPEIIELFQYCIIYDFNNHNYKTIKLLLKNINDSRNNNNLYLSKLKFLLNNAIVLNHFTDTNRLQRIGFFDLNSSSSNDFNQLIEQLLSNTVSFVETKFIAGINLIMHIATNVFNLPDLQNLPTTQQKILLNIVFIPYLNVIKNKNLNKNLFIDDSTLILTTLKSINFLLNNDQYLSEENKLIFYDIINDLFIHLINSEYSNFVLNNIFISLLIKNRKFNNLDKLFTREILNSIVSESNLLKSISCLLNADVKIKKILNNSELFLCNYKIYCKLCDQNEYDDVVCNQCDEQKLEEHPNKNTFYNNYFHDIYKLLITPVDYTTKVNIIIFLPSLFNHTPSYSFDSDIWINLFNDDRMEVRMIFSRYIHLIMQSIKNTEANPTLKREITTKSLHALLKASNLCLTTEPLNKSLQICVVNSILKFALCHDLVEQDILFCFRMTILFMVNVDSFCSREAAMTASEICANQNITPIYLLHTYKTNILKLIISLAVHTFINTDILCVCSLNTVTKMFGYAGTRDFTSKNYKLMLAMLLPFRIKYPNVEELIKEVSKCVQKDLPDALGSAFLTIYPYLYINQPAEITNECLDYVIQVTDRTLYTLLHSDIKKTVAEILVHYHKSPECVLRAFRSILSKNEIYQGTDTKMYKEMSEFIAARFLGVLAFFESTILDIETERELKKETLLSLGEMIRFLGSHHITAFRFKIIAMLKTAVSIQVPGFAKICVKVWTIFIHTVNLQTMGPLLSTVFVSLEPLLEIEEEGINAIAKYLIVSNGVLLSNYIKELFFIERTQFDPEIKSVVKINDQPEFISELKSLMDQIVHENLGVRIYALKYLKNLFATNRTELNHLIIGQNTMDSRIENLLECLMLGCKHADENLQLAAGECLGELGAIDPSLLAPNYAPQYKFALSVHSDAFAMVALDQLCRAYQFQNDTKYVDNFSLAIQEILIERQVCPKTRKKMDVWEAIPERLRPLMEPLLTSCYTDYQNITITKIHPIFGSSKCQSHEEWAIVWITNMIEYIQEENTKTLLTSFRPSIKRSMNILSTFLPYILLHSLQTSTLENQEKIYEELACVFNFVLKSDESTNNIFHNQDRYRGIRSILFNDKNTSLLMLNNQYNDEHNDIGIKCAKLAFNQLEFLAQWCRQYKKTYSQEIDNRAYLVIENFLKRFDKKLLAKVNFKCSEYARALMYIENYIEENPKERLQDELSFLAEIYAELMNPDSLEGAMNLKRVKPTLNEQILSNNLTGRLEESAICFERLLQVAELRPNDMTDMIQCYLGLDQPETALLMAEGFLKNIYDKNQHLIIQESCAEPLWRLTRFDELEELLTVREIGQSPNWGVKCGQLLLNIRKNNFEDFKETIQTTKLNILKMLRIACIEQNSYQKGYPDVMKLHFINEFETVQEVINSFKQSNFSEKPIIDLLSNWSMRKELLQPRPKMIQPLFCLRRILLNELKIWIELNCPDQEIKSKLVISVDESIGQFWIKSAEFARKSGMLQQAQLYIMNAENFTNKELFIEKAKLYWRKGEQSNTFKILERGIQEMEDSGDMKLQKSHQRICAEGKLLIALYNAESMNSETFTTLKYFKDAVRSAQDYEKSLVHLANYLDRIYSALSEEDQQKERGVEMLQDIMFYYGKSLLFGCHYVYQSMPKMLTIWLNYTANTRNDDLYRRSCEKMNNTAERFSVLLPPFVFFTAFSQLVSRICHPSIDVYNVLKTILVKLITHFPQQSLWMISSVFKSSYPNRVKRCSEVFQDKRLAQPAIQKLITDFNSLVEKLIDLTNKTIPANEKHPCVSSLVPSLPKLIASPSFSDIILPIQKHMLPTLPMIGERDKPAESFNVFPNQMRYIKGIKEEMTILMSLQKPRKVTLIGDDGKEYIVMMKPKDDLRKDFRLMEFNAVVKEYLHQDPDARERRLNIRTYAVIPLNEECGIIEWLSNLQAFRNIVINIYKQMKIAMNNREILAAKCAVRDPIAKKRDVFLNTLLPKHPPVFSEWFINRFTTPHNWYHARSSYIKTTAVMSIVGYILGLGDRHGENVLFDATNGDTVHVDFNCLFNRGETFDYPEKVPFRLTHNMVHAMGPLGVEGLYRKCCEITLKILRTQKSTLMSVLKPFVYDPLVSWSRISKTDRQVERTDSEAMGNVNNIEQRLKGLVKLNGKTQNIPLSVEGQVNSIILEATSIDNLASMYIGWGAYL